MEELLLRLLSSWCKMCCASWRQTTILRQFCLPLWKRSVITRSSWQTFILLVYVPYLNCFTAYCRCYFALMIHCPLLIWSATQTLKKSSLPNACFSTQYNLVFFHHFRIFISKRKVTNYPIFCITALSSTGNFLSQSIFCFQA